MKNRIVSLYSVLSLLFVAGVLSTASAQAQLPSSPASGPDSQVQLLSCTFGCDCTAVLTGSIRPDNSSTPAAPGLQGDDNKKNLTFVVVCSNQIIYAGGAYAETSQIQNNPNFGVGIVSAIGNNHKPAFPSLTVDGDFFDFRHSFKDRPAYLHLNNATDASEGVCTHIGSDDDQSAQ